MDTTTTVKSFRELKNQILGRLSQSEDLQQLKEQLLIESDAIPSGKRFTREEINALIGHDITEGIDRANNVISGAIDDL